MSSRAGFRKPVPLDYRHSSNLGETLLHSGESGAPPVFTYRRWLQSISRDLRMMTKLLKDERHCEEEGRAIRFEERKELIYRAETTYNHLRGPSQNSRAHEHSHPVDVEKRKLVQQGIGRCHLVGLHHLEKVVKQIEMGERDPFAIAPALAQPWRAPE